MVGKPAATVMTSSPGLIRLSDGSLEDVRVEIAIKLALEPELTRRQCLTPRKLESSDWKDAPSVPRVSQKSSVELTAASTSSSAKTRPA